MSALTDFLLEQIAEDEAVARASIAAETQERTYYDGRTETLIDRGEWTAGEGAYDECRVEGTFMIIYDEGGHSPEQARHIARHDPARVLADVEAKKAIVEEARDYSPELSEGDNGEWAFDFVLRTLGLPYADHPDYDESWRP